MESDDIRTDIDDQAMENLVAGSRIERTSSGTDDPYYLFSEEEQKAIAERFHKFQEDSARVPQAKRVSLNLAAKAIGCNASMLGQILAGKYPTGKTGQGVWTQNKILKDLDKWITQIKAQQHAPSSSGQDGFVWTKVAEEIRAVAQTTVLLKVMGAVYGPAGIGKSLTLGALLSSIPGSALLTISDSTHSIPTLFRELISILKLEHRRNRSNCRREVCECLKDSGRLLLVDEAHQAPTVVLNAIRQIHDETKIPILFVGLPKLAKQLDKGRGDDSLGATIYSRIGITRDLTERCRHGGYGEPLYTVDDIRKVFSSSKLRLTRDSAEWLTSIANFPEVGGLRACNNAVRLALHIATAGGEEVTEITLAMLTQASQLLHGIEGAKRIANRVAHRQRHVA